MSRWVVFAMLILLQVIFGCASVGNPDFDKYGHPNNTVTVYKQSQITCKNPSEFNYHKLALNDKLFCSVDKSSQSYEFPHGKSFFVAFELPDGNKPYRITVKSVGIVKTHILTKSEAYLFYPFVVLLDSEYNITRFSDTNNLQYDGLKLIENENGGILVNVIIDQDNLNEKYLIVYTSEKVLNKELDVMVKEGSTCFDVLPSGGGGVMVVPNTGRYISSKYCLPSPFGQLKITTSN